MMWDMRGSRSTFFWQVIIFIYIRYLQFHISNSFGDEHAKAKKPDSSHQQSGQLRCSDPRYSALGSSWCFWCIREDRAHVAQRRMACQSIWVLFEVVCWVQGPPIDPVGKRYIVLWRTIGRLWLFLKISVSDISAHFHWLLYWRFSLKSLQASRRQLRTYAWIPSMTLSHGLAWWRYSCCLLNWCHWECWYVAHLAAPWILKPFRFF